MRSHLIITYLLLSGIFANAQQNYATNIIPAELLPYASVVIRNKEVSIEIKEIDNTIYHVKEAITVLNKNGDDMAQMVIGYDKSKVIKFVKGLLYNEYGKQTGKFSESNFKDVNAGSDFSLFEDFRVKYYLPSITSYPYTLSYEYETTSKQSLKLEDWEPNPNNGVAVEKSSFTFICKPDFKIRYKEMNITDKVSIGTNPQGLKTYKWQVNNLKAFKDESFSPYPGTYLSSVKIVPEKFTFYGFNGVFTNWKELGKWEYDNLIASRQDLPEETILHAKEITKDIIDPKLKAKKIYEYMQAKTHYISVQVGIGGYQPFLAADVDKLNYGDCKALVNYTQALLNAVNINSYYCVVKSGRSYKVSMMDDFASMEQGDHIILCMPFKNDTTWADCTSQTYPFGYLGSFTDDRTVLACTPTGGKLLHTPKYPAQTNSESRVSNFVIDNKGDLSGSMATTFEGADYEDRDDIINEPQKEQYRILQHIYPLNNMEIENLQLKQVKVDNPITNEIIKFHAIDYASLNDGKYYFLLNSVNRIAAPPRQLRNRLNDVYINRGYTNNDEITYTLPVGYHLEKISLNVIIDKPFGKYKANMILKGNQLTYKREFVLFEGTYSKDTYQDVINFYQDVDDADEYNVVLIKNN